MCTDYLSGRSVGAPSGFWRCLEGVNNSLDSDLARTSDDRVTGARLDLSTLQAEDASAGGSVRAAGACEALQVGKPAVWSAADVSADLA